MDSATQPAPQMDRSALERLFFAYSQDGMILLRVQHGPQDEMRFIIEAENPAATARLGAIGQAEAFLGRDIREVLPAWLHARLAVHYNACATSGTACRYEIMHGGLTHESIATPVRNAAGVVEHIAVVMRDIGERVHQEKKLNIALARAEEANRSKSEFFASMSHELRTPLNAILGFSEMMEKGFGGSLSHQHVEYVEHIHTSGQHLLAVIADILDLSKIEAGQFRLHEQATPVAHIVESCAIMLRERALRKNLRLDVEVPQGMPDLMADPLRIKQVLLNLLSNAIRFTDEGHVTLSVEHGAQGFTFRVTDTGIGMTPADLAVALQPFGQVEDAYTRNRDGTGLGLSIARHLTELHGGRLELVSTKGKGTEACVILPPSRAVRAGIAC